MEQLSSNKNFNSFLIKELIHYEDKSDCATKHVACLIYGLDKNILYSHGYNKSVSNCKCCERFKKLGDGQWMYKVQKGVKEPWVYDETGERHKKWSLMHEVHAEIMSLTNLSKDEIENSKKLCAFVSWSPCIDCCKSLINAGVTKITYINEFDDCEDIKELCKECNVEFIKLKGDYFAEYQSSR